MPHLFVLPARNISVENLIKARKNALSGGISGLAMCERHKHWMEWSGKVVFGLFLQGRVDEMDAIVTASVSSCNLQKTNFFFSFSFGFSPLSSASFLPLCFSSADV
jgi:hypothetical protein